MPEEILNPSDLHVGRLAQSLAADMLDWNQEVIK